MTRTDGAVAIVAPVFRTVRTSSGILTLCLLLLAAQGCGLARPDGDLFPDPPENAVTFWGHACAYIDIDGFGIATDPVFDKTTFFRRRKIPAPPPSAYDRTKIILISHAHPDHLSPSTLKTFPDEAVVLCPVPALKHVKKLGKEVHTMALGDRYEIPGGYIVAVPARHMGGRYSIRSGEDGRALGYVIVTPRVTVYYSGDTNYICSIDDIGRLYHPDVVLLNINGHLHSTDAVFAALATRARLVIPMHFGAYGYYFFGHYDEPRDNEEMERLLHPFYHVLQVGESARFSTARPDSVAPLP